MFIENRQRNARLYDLKKWEKVVLDIKRGAISKIDQLVTIAKESFERGGARVHVAPDARDALDYVLSVIDEDKVVAQSSTDLPAEIGLYESCERLGINVVHTSTEYRLVQIMPEIPLCYKTNTLAHIKKEEMVQVLSQRLDKTIPPDQEAISYAVQKDVLETLSNTRIGITGANAIAALEGAVYLCEGEMNQARVTLLPVHIVIAGIEKIIPTMLDAMSFIYLQSFYEGGFGARHIMALRGPSAGEGYTLGKSVRGIYGSNEMHVVLVDNGRTRMIREGFEQCLYCIRCWECLNYCPVHELLGPGSGFGFKTPAFGYKGYCGGRGVILTAFTQGMAKAVEAGLYLCTMCGNCLKHCPMEIDIPSMIRRLRAKVAEEG